MNMEFLTLNTGAKMPLEGFGVFQIPDAAQCEEVIYNAVKTGYHLLDTAAAYMNEEAVGKGVARASRMVSLQERSCLSPPRYGFRTRKQRRLLTRLLRLPWQS